MQQVKIFAGGDAGGVQAAMMPGGGVKRTHVTEHEVGDVCARCSSVGAPETTTTTRNGRSAFRSDDDMVLSEQKFLTLPTILTLSRVGAVPALLAGKSLSPSLIPFPHFLFGCILVVRMLIRSRVSSSV